MAEYDFSEFAPQQNQQYDFSEFAPENIKKPENLTSNPYANYLAAGLTGTLKGIGEIPYSAASLFSKALSKVGGPQLDVVNPFDVSTYKDMSPVANALAQNQQANQLSSSIGSLGGSTAALLPLGAANIFGTGASGLGKLAQFVGNNAAQGAAATGLLDPNASAADYAAGAINAPILAGAAHILPKALSRGFLTTRADASKLSQKGSDLYNDAYSTANKTGYKTIPQNYANYAQNALNEINSGTQLGGELTDKSRKILESALDDVYSQMNGTAAKNAFSLKDTHDQMRILNSEIDKLYKSGDNYNASIISGLKNALVKDIEPSVLSTSNKDLSDKFFNAQNFWRENVVPAKEFPTSGKGALGEFLMAKGLAGLPEPLAVGIGAGAGEAGIINRGSIANAFKRYFSTMHGGPSSVTSNLYNPYLQTVTSSLTPQLLQNGGSQ